MEKHLEYSPHLLPAEKVGGRHFTAASAELCRTMADLRQELFDSSKTMEVTKTPFVSLKTLKSTNVCSQCLHSPAG